METATRSMECPPLQGARLGRDLAAPTRGDRRQAHAPLGLRRLDADHRHPLHPLPRGDPAGAQPAQQGPGQGRPEGAQRQARDANTYVGGLGQHARARTRTWPTPTAPNIFMKVMVRDEAGEIWDLKHDIYGKREYPYLWYDRMGKINRRLIDQKGYRRHYAAWVLPRVGADPRRGAARRGAVREDVDPDPAAAGRVRSRPGQHLQDGLRPHAAAAQAARGGHHQLLHQPPGAIARLPARALRAAGGARALLRRR